MYSALQGKAFLPGPGTFGTPIEQPPEALPSWRTCDQHKQTSKNSKILLRTGTCISHAQSTQWFHTLSQLQNGKDGKAVSGNTHYSHRKRPRPLFSAPATLLSRSLTTAPCYCQYNRDSGAGWEAWSHWPPWGKPCLQRIHRVRVTRSQWEWSHGNVNPGIAAIVLARLSTQWAQIWGTLHGAHDALCQHLSWWDAGGHKHQPHSWLQWTRRVHANPSWPEDEREQAQLWWQIAKLTLRLRSQGSGEQSQPLEQGTAALFDIYGHIHPHTLPALSRLKAKASQGVSSPSNNIQRCLLGRAFPANLLYLISQCLFIWC